MSQEKNAQNVRKVDLAGFGPRLRDAFNGAKNVVIAGELEISEAAVRNYLDGRIPSAEILATISLRTKCSIHWLITGELPMMYSAPPAPSRGLALKMAMSEPVEEDDSDLLGNVALRLDEALRDYVRELVREERRLQETANREAVKA